MTRTDGASAARSASTIAPVVRSTHVAVPPAQAFDLFTSRVRDWWDPSVFSPERGDASFVDLVIESRQGGRWFARTADGREAEWGRVEELESPSRLLIDWHPHGVSMRMVVAFTGSHTGRTDIEMTLTGFEGFGKDANRMREIHDAKVASLLDGFAAFAARQSRPLDVHVAGDWRGA